MNGSLINYNKPIQNPSVFSRPIFDDNILLVNCDTGASLALNSTGKLIWSLFDGKRTEMEIVAKVCENFKNVPDNVSLDVTSLISALSEQGFIGFEIDADSLENGRLNYHG